MLRLQTLNRLFCSLIVVLGVVVVFENKAVKIAQARMEEYAQQITFDSINIEYKRQKAEKTIPDIKFNLGAGKLIYPFIGAAEDILTQGFGQNPNAYGGMGTGLTGHPGVDWRTPEGTTLLAAHGGLVVEAFSGYKESDGKNGYGNRVRIRWKEGFSGYETIDAHLSSVSVSAGQRIRQGEVIGLSGNTGFSTGPHVHFGIRGLFCGTDTTPVNDCTVTDMDNGYLGFVDPVPFLK